MYILSQLNYLLAYKSSQQRHLYLIQKIQLLTALWLSDKFIIVTSCPSSLAPCRLLYKINKKWHCIYKKFADLQQQNEPKNLIICNLKNLLASQSFLFGFDFEILKILLIWTMKGFPALTPLSPRPHQVNSCLKVTAGCEQLEYQVLPAIQGLNIDVSLDPRIPSQKFNKEKNSFFTS